jgi:hypothetical protein
MRLGFKNTAKGQIDNTATLKAWRREYLFDTRNLHCTLNLPLVFCMCSEERYFKAFLPTNALFIKT